VSFVSCRGALSFLNDVRILSQKGSGASLRRECLHNAAVPVLCWFCLDCAAVLSVWFVPGNRHSRPAIVTELDSSTFPSPQIVFGNGTLAAPVSLGSAASGLGIHAGASVTSAGPYFSSWQSSGGIVAMASIGATPFKWFSGDTEHIGFYNETLYAIMGTGIYRLGAIGSIPPAISTAPTQTLVTGTYAGTTPLAFVFQVRARGSTPTEQFRVGP
jgi:hypothetical protein